MRKTIFTVIAAIFFIGFCGAISAAEESYDAGEASMFYKACIDNEIFKCIQKESLMESTCENLQRYAKIKKGKAAFLAENKNVLIQEMLERRLVLRTPRVEAYLNQRYFKSKSADIATQAAY